MGADEMLDLTDVVWPICLLRFNEILGSRPPGSTLEVRIRDPLVFDNVKTIVHNSEHQITRIDQASDCFHICIRKSDTRVNERGGDNSNK
jgi:TusA-related sulfurtransferase